MGTTTKNIARGKEWESEIEEEKLPDFGFTTGNDEPMVSPEDKNVKLELVKTQEKLKFVVNLLYKMFDSFCVNPEIPTIKWPNRLERIKQIRDMVEKKLKE
jgi:hypothetical protein